MSPFEKRKREFDIGHKPETSGPFDYFALVIEIVSNLPSNVSLRRGNFYLVV